MDRIDPADLPGRACSVAAALDVVGDRWSLLVVREVGFGHHRFSEILAGTGAPRDRLTARLKLLVEAGILERRPYLDHPPRSEYHLTGAGRALGPVLHALRGWGDAHAVTAPPVRQVHGGPNGVDGMGGVDEHEVRGQWVCTTCGVPVRGSHARLVPA